MAGHVLALVVLSLSYLPIWLRSIGVLALLLFAVYNARRYRLPPVHSLRRQGDDWYLSRDGQTVKAELTGHWHSPWLALLYFRGEEGGRCCVEVLPDMLPDADWRRLLWVLRGFMRPGREPTP
ncbi:MAG: hypothetical protein HYV16_03575 [Gammaproteobacteria bacterium]|nr:hypothetical protein [Gammaproteobacteria bacterium]